MTRMMGHYDMDGQGKILPRPQEWLTSQFGPQWPLPVEPLDRPREDTGFPEPRIYQYPYSWNLQLFDQKSVSWETLRQAAETPLFRACIEIRKTELAELDWAIQIAKPAAEQVARQQRKSTIDVQNDLREKYEAEIARLTEFWETPDRRNGRDFPEGIGVLVEEQLTWDALAIYPRYTYGGRLSDLMVIDGSTVKPLLDEQGGRPLPPGPAYQQILYGFPRGEFTADTADLDGETVVPGGMTANQLIYRRRVVRTRTPYGYSPTEQALLDGLLYNKRFGWMVAEYTEGSQPAQFLKNTGDVDWSARQLLQYEKAFNDRYSGRTAERYRYAILPPGIEPAQLAQIQERYKADYDLHLIARVAMHFGVTLPELGFTDKGSGLGSTGYHEGNEAVLFRRSRLPDIKWYARLITQISRVHLGMPAELEFSFLGLEEEDEASIDAVVQSKTSSGRLTLNESRAMAGLPAYQFPEADMPMLQTARGIVFIQGSAKSAPAGILIEPASEISRVQVGAAVAGAPEGHVGGGTPTRVGASSPTQRRPIGAAGGGSAAKELETFRKWLAKHPDSSRRFEFDSTYEELSELDPDLIDENLSKAMFKATGGGSGPKASSPHSLPLPSSGQDGVTTLPWSPYMYQRL
jgi:hypothetical protein